MNEPPGWEPYVEALRHANWALQQPGGYGRTMGDLAQSGIVQMGLHEPTHAIRSWLVWTIARVASRGGES